MISIFALPSYVGRGYHAHVPPHATRLSSRIRAEEMSAYLGAKLNPTEGFENDVCIYVKPRTFDQIRDGDWVDFLDGGRFFRLLKDRPKINVIAASKNSYDILKAELPNKIIFIPHHHLNLERAKRTRHKINTCGYIGSPSPIAFKIYSEIGKRLKEVGFKFITSFDYKTRGDATSLYKKIDIMVIGAWEVGDPNPHKIPTKIINAASFGIPSIAFPLRGYKEIEGYYVRASNMKELLTEVEKFKDEDYYKKWSGKVLKMSEKYHISEVSKLYKKLK